MARFYPLYVRRSDGRLETVVKGKRKEPNEPTTEQLDQKPDKHGISDFYREVGSDEMKSLDWRRKLGGMLARELGWKDKSGQDTGCMLVAFPENYRLYEHVKKTEKDGKTEVKSKTHAGGGNDRQDAYLYGHPSGRRKRFRSPADFFPHLLWLCTDESADPDNCGCKLCSPEELENIIPGAKVKKPDVEVKFVSQTVAPKARQSSIQGASVKPEATAAAQRPAPPRQLLPTPLPQRKTNDQNIDSQYRTFIYRPGELVWFQRGQAWGLGAVTRRWYTTGQQHHYTVQPLSYPWNHPQATTKSSDHEMRPWLAWSVPRFTNNELNNLPEPPTYDTADWQGMMQKRYGNGDLEVDGSILAAKAIDATYTPFNPTSTSHPEPGVEEKHYAGLYLGAEKFWAGDPMRLQIGSGTDIMVLHDVVERKRPGQQLPSTHLVGDVYTLATVTHANPSIPTPAAANNNPHLPIRLTEDLADRNAKSIPVRRTASYWKLVAAQQKLSLNDVKGRWYEASILLPLLQPQQYEEIARKGEVQEASLWMNSRGDCLNTNRAPGLPRVNRVNVRKESRREALGKAVPEGVVILDGVDAPAADNGGSGGAGATGGESGGAAGRGQMDIDPRFDTADGGGSGGGRAAGGEQAGDGLDDFMNLDAGEMEEQNTRLPGFGPSYGSQASQGGYF